VQSATNAKAWSSSAVPSAAGVLNEGYENGGIVAMHVCTTLNKYCVFGWSSPVRSIVAV
jgi:hypothetical protein